MKWARVYLLSCFSRVWLLATVCTVARQASLFTVFSRQEVTVRWLSLGELLLQDWQPPLNHLLHLASVTGEAGTVVLHFTAFSTRWRCNTTYLFCSRGTRGHRGYFKVARERIEKRNLSLLAFTFWSLVLNSEKAGECDPQSASGYVVLTAWAFFRQSWVQLLASPSPGEWTWASTLIDNGLPYLRSSCQWGEVSGHLRTLALQ